MTVVVWMEKCNFCGHGHWTDQECITHNKTNHAIGGEMNKKLIPIDMDLIRELRRTRKYDEANELIKAHQLNIKQSWIDTRKKIHYIVNKVTKHKCIKKGICPRCYKNKTTDHYYCEECSAINRIEARKYNIRKPRRKRK